MRVGVRRRRKAEVDKWEEGSRELRVIEARNLETISLPRIGVGHQGRMKKE